MGNKLKDVLRLKKHLNVNNITSLFHNSIFYLGFG